MKLTKEQAIKEHRKMWKWISRQIMKDYKENYSIKDIASYKKIYLENNFENEYIYNNCFCCEYAGIQYRCVSCLIYWNDDNTSKISMEGYYGSLNKIFYSITIDSVNKDSIEEYFVCEGGAKKLSKMAYKIAMLEERKDNV